MGTIQLNHNISLCAKFIRGDELGIDLIDVSTDFVINGCNWSSPVTPQTSPKLPFQYQLATTVDQVNTGEGEHYRRE